MKNPLITLLALTLIMAASAVPSYSKEVVVYSARNEHLIQPLFEDFTRQTGVKVKFITDKAGVLVQRLKAEGSRTPADVLITVDAGNLWYAAEQGLLQKTNSKTLEANIPGYLRDPAGSWFGLSVRARTIVYSTERVDPSELSTYEALGEPAWKGRLLLRTSKKVYNQSLVAMLIAEHGVEETEGIVRAWVDNLAADPFSNDTKVMVAIAAGQGDVGIVNTYYFGRLIKKDPIYIDTSPSMQKVMELVSMAAESDTTVALMGETGSGKGLLAQWIHDHSRRSSGAFVEINCSGLKGEILASELFGHVRGAYTSAVQDRRGLIQVADGGTLFLDEISNMSLSVQAEFLKVIEDKQYRRLGEDKVRKSDFRLICSTNKDLFEETRQGRFRQDLYFRIHVFPIRLPPLRKRLEDLYSLIKHILKTLGKPDVDISDQTLELLSKYPWPGNIREMKNVLERALLLARGATLSADHFPGLGILYPVAKRKEIAMDLKDLEKVHIWEVINRFGGDKVKAAEVLGISRATLYRKLKKNPRLI